MPGHIDLKKADLSRVKGVPVDHLPPRIRRHEAMFLGPFSESILDKILATGRLEFSRVGASVLISTPSFLRMLDQGLPNLSPAKPRKAKPRQAVKPARSSKAAPRDQRAAP